MAEEKKKIRVCSSGSCRTFGAREIMDTISKATGVKPGEQNDAVDLDFCGCLGYCARSPNVLINDDHIVFSAIPETMMEEIAAGGEDMEGRVIELNENLKVGEPIEGLENDILNDI